MTAEPFEVVALIAAHNEADIIGLVLEHLIAEGVSPYLIDDSSTDETVAVASRYLGRGLIAIEPSGNPPEELLLDRILRRKEELARELDARWFIHHDADEFLESPWKEIGLRDAIARVERLGFNAIDFETLHFPPTRELGPGEDPREAFTHVAPADPREAVRLRAWKRTAQVVDLAASGGREAVFQWRRVFPVRFISRQYPIRGEAHGERKSARERRAPLPCEEAARGREGDAAAPEKATFLRDPLTLMPYDAEMVRLLLFIWPRGVEGAAGSAALRAELDQVYASRSWRWMAPARRVLEGSMRAARWARHVVPTILARRKQASRDGPSRTFDETRPLVLVHVPKTAGTSFTRSLSGVIRGRDHHFVAPRIWMAEGGELRRQLETLTLRARPGTLLVHGHCCAARLRYFFPGGILVTWLRDPVERVVSMYHYWRRHPDLRHRGSRETLERDATVADFAEREVLRNVQSRFCDLPLGDFAFVGITEDFERGLRLFERKFELPRLPVGRENLNPERRGGRYSLDDATRTRIADLNRDDLDLYGRARERFERECREYGV